ncbi:NADPH-cytochrome p450 reductase [Schizosaccharomyces japonicus yFS275]|uniref:NADPH--cytochrome P450 reductase n=1 Tax=Schizosaccharomyces japonicus (strain yFS275 / FY16936) TaxID=402676 RepID=B6K6E0_SCHJY|nr:NADPH-cytochrome p450 reductase [Schizosaccharomyces japonicus yFS275]EEB09094.1 NADPH-cytochrome p450 reductase [Schizosaccharomyces japonicus yFS275]
MSILDILILMAVLAGTAVYFTHGKLWDKPKAQAAAFQGAGESFVEFANENDVKVGVFFGSQTGTAEDYAHRLAKDITASFGVNAVALDLMDYRFDDLDQLGEDRLVVFVVATYGEGDPTDNATDFMDFIGSDRTEFSNGKGADEQPLEGIRYAVFGLGNHTYQYYNAMGKKVDACMSTLGATRVGLLGLGDDAEGMLEEDYLEWKEDFLADFAGEFELSEKKEEYKPMYRIIEKPEVKSDSPSVFLGELNRQQLQNIPISAPVSSVNPLISCYKKTKELFKSDNRNCLHIEFDIKDSGLSYKTGDYVSVWPMNPSQAVDDLLDVLGLTAKRNTVIVVQPFNTMDKAPVLSPTTYDTVFRYYYDICGVVSRQFLSAIAVYAPTAETKAKLEKLGSDKDRFRKTVLDYHLNLAQVLRLVSPNRPFTNIPFSLLLEDMTHMKPRYYSISSSSLVHPDTVHITAVVSRKEWNEQEHVFYGVATNYLLAHCLHNGHQKKHHPNGLEYQIDGPRAKWAGGVPVFIKKSNFHLAPPNVPIIMVGPGTGVAPFRAFVMERAKLASDGVKVAKTVLFYGCQRSNEDFLYADEWKQYKEQMGDAFEMFCAFSREQDHKVYVQHKMLEHADLISDVIDNGGVFYICGDAERMAKDVTNALAEILTTPKVDGAKRVKELRDNNRFLEDTW